MDICYLRIWSMISCWNIRWTWIWTPISNWWLIASVTLPIAIPLFWEAMERYVNPKAELPDQCEACYIKNLCMYRSCAARSFYHNDTNRCSHENRALESILLILNKSRSSCILDFANRIMEGEGRWRIRNFVTESRRKVGNIFRCC